MENDFLFSTIIDTEEIKQKEAEALQKIDELDQMFEHVLDMLNNSKDYFDTTTAEYFREIVNKYISTKRDKLKVDLIPYINSLDKVCEAYTNVNEAIKKGVENNVG